MRLDEALAGEHEELRGSARRVLADHPRRAGELGWFGLAVPEKYGGAGLGIVETCVIAEEVGRTLADLPLLGAAMASAALLEAGGGEWLPRIASGEISAALVCDPGWVLDAELLVVGTKALIGVARTPIPTLDETRRMVSVAIEVPAPPARGLDVGRVVLAAEQLGVAERCLDLAVEHAKTRVQFGRAIGSFQAVKHLLAEVVVRVEAARSASRWAAWVADHAPAELPVAAAVARATCTDAALRASADALQVFGGIGFTWEHPIHRYLKRARSQAVLLGSAADSRDAIARHLRL